MSLVCVSEDEEIVVDISNKRTLNLRNKNISLITFINPQNSTLREINLSCNKISNVNIVWPQNLKIINLSVNFCKTFHQELSLSQIFKTGE